MKCPYCKAKLSARRKRKLQDHQPLRGTVYDARCMRLTDVPLDVRKGD